MSENTPRVRIRERIRLRATSGLAQTLPTQLDAAADGSTSRTTSEVAPDENETSVLIPAPSPVPATTVSRAAAYEVGYRKPPKASRFQPGRSGNPKGRPKKHSTISGAFEAELNAKHPITINGRAMRLTQAEIVAKQTLKKAMAGDPRATALILKLEMARKHMASSLTPRSPNPGLQRGADDGPTPIDVPFSETDRTMMSWFLSTIDTGNDDVAVNAIGVGEDDRSADDSRADDDDDDQVRIARGGLARRRVP